MLSAGLVLILAIVAMSVIGPLFVERDSVNVGYAMPDQTTFARVSAWH